MKLYVLQKQVASLLGPLPLLCYPPSVHPDITTQAEGTDFETIGWQPGKWLPTVWPIKVCVFSSKKQRHRSGRQEDAGRKSVTHFVVCGHAWHLVMVFRNSFTLWLSLCVQVYFLHPWMVHEVHHQPFSGFLLVKPLPPGVCVCVLCVCVHACSCVHVCVFSVFVYILDHVCICVYVYKCVHLHVCVSV